MTTFRARQGRLEVTGGRPEEGERPITFRDLWEEQAGRAAKSLGCRSHRQGLIEPRLVL